ncbi:hypothetical protein EVAR_8986_1 [Eumeta japonica]|uniref:Uncharacterized protein n=1 Tax=Eumeta variegata TaxID=151549 RepID=A0A4C1WSA7_EUMVA|nr:hypothetical protein EVAR_8986_1 [Eumeta japonica]
MPILLYCFQNGIDFIRNKAIRARLVNSDLTWGCARRRSRPSGPGPPPPSAVSAQQHALSDPPVGRLLRRLRPTGAPDDPPIRYRITDKIKFYGKRGYVYSSVS